VSRQVFLDSDNLQDLSLLFGYVENNTDTLVVLCTASILSRPWCVGEMTTAMLHDVDTILLLFPDFTWPTDEFVERYAEHVEGVLSLAKYGISVDHVQEALKLLTSRPNILLPRKVTLSMMDVVASKLVARRRGQMESSTHRGIATKHVPSKRGGSEENHQPCQFEIPRKAVPVTSWFASVACRTCCARPCGSPCDPNLQGGCCRGPR